MYLAHVAFLAFGKIPSYVHIFGGFEKRICFIFTIFALHKLGMYWLAGHTVKDVSFISIVIASNEVV
jgi:hypothetical protein